MTMSMTCTKIDCRMARVGPGLYELLFDGDYLNSLQHMFIYLGYHFDAGGILNHEIHGSVNGS